MNFNIASAFRKAPVSSIAVAAAEILAVLVVAFLMMIPDRAQAQSGNVYGTGQAQVYSQTEEAVVLQVRVTRTEPSWQARAAGTGVGAVVGGLLGRKASNNSAATVIGTTLGGLAGERVTTAMATNQAQEIVLQLPGRNGTPARIITIVQPAPFDAVASGQRVFLINSAGTYRVVRALQQPVAYYR